MKKLLLLLGLLAPIQLVSAMEENAQPSQCELNKQLFKVIKEKGSFGQVLELIWKGANVNDAQYSSPSTPLQTAVSEGLLDICKLLIEKGAKVNARGSWSARTALEWAAFKGYLEICKLLLQNG